MIASTRTTSQSRRLRFVAGGRSSCAGKHTNQNALLARHVELQPFQVPTLELTPHRARSRQTVASQASDSPLLAADASGTETMHPGVITGKVPAHGVTCAQVVRLGIALDSNQLLNLASSALQLLADMHRRGFVHGSLRPETIFLPNHIPVDSERTPINVLFIDSRSDAVSEPPSYVHSSPPETAAAMYIAPELLDPTFGSGPWLDPAAVLYSVGPDGHLVSSEDNNIIGTNTQGSLYGMSTASPSSDVFQLGCVLAFLATGAHAQQTESELEADVVPLKWGVQGPVGDFLSQNSTLSCVVKGMTDMNQTNRLTAEEALEIVSRGVFPLHTRPAITLNSSRLPYGFYFTELPLLCPPWATLCPNPLTEAFENESSVSGSSIKVEKGPNGVLRVLFPADGGTMPNVLAATAVMACTNIGAATLVTLQASLAFTAIPVFIGGCMLSSAVFSSAFTQHILDIGPDSWTFAVAAHVDEGNVVADSAQAVYQGKTRDLLGAKVMTLRIPELHDDDIDTALVLLSQECSLRFGVSLSHQEQLWLGAFLNHYMQQHLLIPVTVDNDLYPSTCAHIDDDDAIHV